VLYLVAYSFISLFLVLIFERGHRKSQERFFAANRQLGGLVGAMCIAASWIWAPALFVSSQIGYLWGYSGLVWFVVPNMLALVLFAPLAAKVRSRIPSGFTYLEYLKTHEKNCEFSFRKIQLTVLLLVQLIALSMQVTAGSELLSNVSHIPYITVAAFMTFAPLTYCLIAGLPSSILTDALQYVVMLSAIIFIYSGVPLKGDFLPLLQQPFHPFDGKVLVEIGIPSALTLLFGIFSDHQQWQRAFATKLTSIRSPFFGGAILHGIVTFSLGTLGALIAQSGYIAKNPQLVGAEFVSNMMPHIFVSAFIVMALAGLCSTVSSSLCAFGSLCAMEWGAAGQKNSEFTDLASRQKSTMFTGRKAMVLLALFGFLIATVRLPIIVLWLTAGIVRLCTAAPTLASVFDPYFQGKKGTIAIALSLVFGAPLFVYGIVYHDSLLRDIGMSACLAISTSTILWPTRTKSFPVPDTFSTITREYVLGKK
jgi:Na+/proline symporter